MNLCDVVPMKRRAFGQFDPRLKARKEGQELLFILKKRERALRPARGSDAATSRAPARGAARDAPRVAVAVRVRCRRRTQWAWVCVVRGSRRVLSEARQDVM